MTNLPSYMFPESQMTGLTSHFTRSSFTLRSSEKGELQASMSVDTSFEATAVVRSYSFEVEQRLGEGNGAHHLSQALVEQRNGGHLEDITSPWRSFFEADKLNNFLRKGTFSIQAHGHRELTKYQKPGDGYHSRRGWQTSRQMGSLLSEKSKS